MLIGLIVALALGAGIGFWLGRRRSGLPVVEKKPNLLVVCNHDLRQPLQALGLFISALEQRSLPDDLRRIVLRLDSSFQVFQGQFDNLVELAKLDEGVVEVHWGSLSPATLYQRLNDELAPLAEQKGLTLRFVASKRQVWGDPALLHRLLRQLILNGLQSCSAGGVVVGLRQRSKGWRIEVWDSGMGITPADLVARLSATEPDLAVGARGNKGLGVGLVIAVRLANLMGGRLNGCSRIGRGTVVGLDLLVDQRIIG